MEASPQRPKLLVIAGPTASGKSDLALWAAKKYNGEIICADSLTVRKYMDIGSAKPSLSDQAGIGHHLLDVAEPCEDFTAVSFKKLAREAMADIQKRGKLPVLVGGTGLYLDAIVFDFEFLPPGNRSEREKLNRLSLDELMEIIGARGISTKGIDIRNKRRLIRLIETGGARPTSSPMLAGTLIIGINPPGEILKEQIRKRINNMIEAGLEHEVKNLAERYGWDCEGLKAIGYQQWRDYFEGTRTLEETINRIISATNGLAKRQRTWLKRNAYINWFATPEEAQKFLKNML